MDIVLAILILIVLVYFTKSIIVAAIYVLVAALIVWIIRSLRGGNKL